MSTAITRLYHGSDVAIKRPSVSYNTGFADLGHGFYLTSDHEAARGRARTRARGAGGVAAVSAYDLDEAAVPWLCWGADGLVAVDERRIPSAEEPFGLCFDATPAGYAAWASYIKGCRQGHTEVASMGSPAIVRGWIATMEIEMVCSDFITAQELAEALDPTELIEQYCLLDQDLIDHSLAFVESEVVNA